MIIKIIPEGKVTKKKIFGKILGLMLLAVGVASWTYLILYSIRPH